MEMHIFFGAIKNHSACKETINRKKIIDFSNFPINYFESVLGSEILERTCAHVSTLFHSMP